MMEDLRKKALAQHLGIDVCNVWMCGYDDVTLGADGEGVYLVVTDDEANDLWDKSLESYFEECVLSQIPEHLQYYFDEELWKQDAKTDGRGHALSLYDSCEESEEVEDEVFYIFRIE